MKKGCICDQISRVPSKGESLNLKAKKVLDRLTDVRMEGMTDGRTDGRSVGWNVSHSKRVVLRAVTGRHWMSTVI